MHTKSFGLCLGVLVAVAAALLSCGSDNEEAKSPAEGVNEIVRQLLQSGTPDTAAGQTLELTRVIVPAGEQIAPHTHPGVQLAFIAEGTLTYSVINGEVEVMRDAGSPEAETETVGSGQTVDLRPGDSLIETPGMSHTARNDGDVAVVIYLSALFPTGAPASSPASQ